MNQEEKSQIDELKDTLYSRNAPDIRTKRRLRFGSGDVDEIKTDWEHPEIKDEDVEFNKKYKDTSMSFFTKLLIFSIIVFVLALGAGAYLLFNGSNIISADNIDINIGAPVSVAGGEPISFDIQVSNKNNIKLEAVDVSVDFPAGTVDAIDTTKELKNFREAMADIEPNMIGKKTVSAVVYGEENSKKEIKVTIDYRVKGSSSLFQKEKVIDLLISSSPLTLAVSSFKEVNSGQEFELSVAMNSNSKETIKNVLLKAVYPFGFTYISSDNKPIADNSLWRIGDIPPNGKKVIKIKGKLDGQDDESRVFRFTTGAQSAKNEKVIGTEYITSTQDISIKKPFITVGVALNGDAESTEYVGEYNDPIRVEVSYFNNLPTAVIDGEIHVKLSGTAYDKLSVSPDQGLYKSENNEIIWNGITTNELKNIPAGGSGKVSFSITPKNASNSSRIVINPDMSIDVSVNGSRRSESNVPENIVSSAKRHIRISSDISLAGQVTRSGGPFMNSGPIPPKAEQATTYTLIWTIDNTSSSVSNAQVKSSLPPYMKWVGKTDPSTENVSYNSVNGQIVWDVGNMGTYNPSNTHRRQVAFQVSLTPSVTQVGQVLNIINQSTFTAQDDFTNQQLNSTLNALNTRYSTDPTYKDGDEIIAR
jgi:hypothetical protein